MKIKRTGDLKPDVPMGSLNDIMFFLLLFFLIVATFANPNVIKLILPKATSSQTLSKKQVTLSITKEKHYYIDNKPILFVNIEPELNKVKGQIQDVTILLRAESSLTIQDLVDVLEIGNRLQIRMILATDKGN
jgi:biopolymer transport protein ExbD